MNSWSLDWSLWSCGALAMAVVTVLGVSSVEAEDSGIYSQGDPKSAFRCTSWVDSHMDQLPFALSVAQKERFFFPIQTRVMFVIPKTIRKRYYTDASDAVLATLDQAIQQKFRILLNPFNCIEYILDHIGILVSTSIAADASLQIVQECVQCWRNRCSSFHSGEPGVRLTNGRNTFGHILFLGMWPAGERKRDARERHQ